MKRLLLCVLVGCSSSEDAPITDSASEDAALDSPVSIDSSALDSVVVDSFVPETMVDAAKSGCALAKLCEGFEAPEVGSPPDPKIWTKSVAGSGTLEIASDMAHSGKKSLKIVSPSGSYETFIKESVTFPATKNSFWGRLWFRFEAAMPKDFVHWTLFEARGTTSNNRVRIGGINNPHGGSFFSDAFIFNVETAGMGEKGIDDDPTPEIPTKTWICVEWNYIGESGKNSSRMFWNGTERPKMHVETPWFETKFVMPEMSELYLGWAIYQTISEPYVVHVDDVAIGDVRLGCD